MQRILVTGGTGFIGKSVVPLLLKEKYKIVLLARNPAKAKKLFPKAIIVKGSILDKKALEKAMKGCEGVVHMAGLVEFDNIDDVYETNVIGTRNVVDAAKKAKIKRIVYASSVSVHWPSARPITEKHKPRPYSFYGLTKLLGEEEVLRSGIPSVSLRIAAVYGVGSRWFDMILRSMAGGFPVINSGNYNHLVHASDVAHAVLLALKKGKGPYIIADEQPVRLREFMEALAAYMGKRPVYIPVWFARMMATAIGKRHLLEIGISNRVYNIGKAKRELGYRPRADLSGELLLMSRKFNRKR
ncbi:MAG: NAD(P)-dependent oxidoreductase [Candidatus Aenigmarchaeota archaeon]|nr:NAD(P)-dependent oxidoreductase [Candidatus Aenigmarchaeota archaeon]